MSSNRMGQIFKQFVSGLVVVAMLAQNPVFSQNWDTERNETLGNELWRSGGTQTQENAPEQLWQTNPPNGPSPSKRGTEYLWGNNPQPNTFDPDAAWKQSSDKAQEGAQSSQSFTDTINANEAFPSSPEQDDRITYGEGETVSRDTLFGGRGSDVSARDAYGSDDALRSRGSEAQTRLETDSSIEGDVYRLLDDQSSRARPDYREDPAWETTDDILGGMLTNSEIQCDEDAGGVRYENCRRNFEPTLPQGCGFDRESEAENYVIEKTVFSYKGCFDHNYVDIQVAGAEQKTFDANAEGRRGYYVPHTSSNEINDAWDGFFRNRANGGSDRDRDHLSGIYYDFNPIQEEQLDGFVIDNISAQIRNIKRRNAAGFAQRVVQNPRPSNNWVTRLRLDDLGVGGGAPNCPYGRSDGAVAWIEFDVVVIASGTRLKSDRWEDKKPSCSIADRQYGGFCEKNYECAAFESDNDADQTVAQATTATQLVSSRDYRYYREDFPQFSSIDSIQLVRQVSDSACRRGSSYGIEGNTVWVDNGCRAEFRVSGEVPRYMTSGPNCIVQGGEKFCDGLAPPPAPGIPAGCMEVNQDWQCDFPGQAQPDTCEPLDEDPACGHLSSTCAPGATQAPPGSGESERPRREKNVFSFEGCFDHNRIEFPIAGVPEQAFDARFDPTNPGYRVIPTVENQIDELWGGPFRVSSRNAGGAGDNLSGIYYAFRPYEASDLEGLDPQDLDIRLENLSLRNNAPFSYDIVQRPSEANGWTVAIDINDSGVDGGAPGCPFGENGAPLGWASFDLRVGFGSGSPDRDERCYAWEETYRCEAPQNNAACAAQDLMGSDYGDCEVTYEEETYTKTVNVTTTETCQRPRVLSSCEIERDISLVDRATQKTVTESGCFDQRTTSVNPGWSQKYTNVEASVTSTGSNVSVSMIDEPSADNNWTATLLFDGSRDSSGNCPSAHTGSARVKWTGQQVIAEQNDFPAEDFNSPCLRVSDGITNAVGSCVQQSTLPLEDHLRDVIEPMYPGEFDNGRFCQYARVDYEPSTSSSQVCYENASGQTICSERDAQADAQAEANECAALEQRMQAGECTKVETRPMGGGTRDGGVQYYFEEVYDCIDQDVGERTVTKTRTKEVYDCSGGVSCMGEECVNVERDVTGEFEKAVGLLDMLNSFQSDMECSTDNPESCTIFPGEAQKCKEALGGWVDCCETPGGVSLANYIALIKSTQKLDSAIMASEGMPAVQGSWKAIRDPAVNAFDASKEFFTSAMDNITGSTTQAAGEAASEGILSTWQDKAINKTGQFLANNFPGAEKIFFKETTKGAFQLAPGFSTALSVIGTAYMIYQLADLLVNIIWECTQEELQLGADRKLQKTHYLGSYCSQEIHWGCIEEQKSFCVFNAPLPRIVQEQVRPQLGMSWGSAKDPNCEGIPVGRLDEIDWTKVDLGEWVDMLDLTGNMPDTSTLTPEQLTGSQSSLATEDGRLDVIERTRQRAEGANIGKENEDARRNLWGEK